MSTRKFISLFLFAVMVVTTSQAASTYTQSVTSGASGATLTIKPTATTNQWSVVLVVTGTFGAYGNYQVYLNGAGSPNPYVDTAGTYPITVDSPTIYGNWGGQYQSGMGVPTQTIPLLTWSAPTPDAQTVTITPTALTISQGRQASFTASGGHNGYLWSLTGGGSLAENGGENALFSATTEGTFTVQVRSPAGNGYAVSNFATATITVTKASRIKIKLPENKGYRPVEYMIMQGSTTLGIETQMPGALSRTVEKVVTTDEPVTVLSRVVGIVQDDDSGVWKAEPGAVMTPTPSPPINGYRWCSAIDFKMNFAN